MTVDSHEVFVSYPNADAAVADMVVEALEGSGLRCWLAPRDVAPGIDWAGSIIEAIEASKLMVLVYTDATNASQHILREVRQGADSGIPILPFRTTDAELAPALAYYLGGTHWLDAYGGDLADHLETLIDRVRAILAGEQPFKRRAAIAAARQPASSPTGPSTSPPAQWWKRVPALAAAFAATALAVVVVANALSVDDPADQTPTTVASEMAEATVTSAVNLPTVTPPPDVSVEFRGVVPERELALYGILGAVGARFGFDGLDIWSYTTDDIATALTAPTNHRGLGDAGAQEPDELVLFLPAVAGEHLFQLDFPDGRTARMVFEIPDPEGPEFEIGEGIDQQVVERIESEVDEAAATAASVTGYATGNFTVFVEADEAVMAERHCELRDVNCTAFGQFWQRRWVTVDEGDLFVVTSHSSLERNYGGSVAHHYARLVMGLAAGRTLSEAGSSLTPTWLWEGTATHLGSQLAFPSHYPTDEQTMRANATYDAGNRPSLASLESWDSWVAEPGRSGQLAAYAVHVLWRDFPSPQGPLGFFDALRTGSTWEEAFEQAHGLSVEEFYEHFENL